MSVGGDRLKDLQLLILCRCLYMLSRRPSRIGASVNVLIFSNSPCLSSAAIALFISPVCPQPDSCNSFVHPRCDAAFSCSVLQCVRHNPSRVESHQLRLWPTGKSRSKSGKHPKCVPRNRSVLVGLMDEEQPSNHQGLTTTIQKPIRIHNKHPNPQRISNYRLGTYTKCLEPQLFTASVEMDLQSSCIIKCLVF